MAVVASLIGDSPVKLWSLSSRDRVKRQLSSLGVPLVDSTNHAPQASHQLLVRCDFLYELRGFKALLQKDAFLLMDDQGLELAAALVPAEQAEAVRQVMTQQFEQKNSEAGELLLESLPSELPRRGREQLGVYDSKLRRADLPMLEPLSPEREQYLEDQLYGNSYKGVTDLVTKWLWPQLAKRLVRFCARRAITPNQVTLVSFVLVLVTGYLFYLGYFGWGLLAAWIMTLLDTVDGKLARVRVEASKLGHLFDHGIDLVSPPFWYLLWAMGLAHWGLDVKLSLIAILLFPGYIAGRLAELAFQKICGGSLFAWRPFDSWFRLITARRNPCLIILTTALFLSSPSVGLWGVIVWTLGTTLVLWVRLAQALEARRHLGKQLPSWLEEPDASDRYPHSYPVFSGTQGAYKS